MSEGRSDALRCRDIQIARRFAIRVPSDSLLTFGDTPRQAARGAGWGAFCLAQPLSYGLSSMPSSCRRASKGLALRLSRTIRSTSCMKASRSPSFRSSRASKMGRLLL